MLVHGLAPSRCASAVAWLHAASASSSDGTGSGGTGVRRCMTDIWEALRVDQDRLVSRRESATILKRLLPSLSGIESEDSGRTLVRCIAIRIGRAIVEGKL